MITIKPVSAYEVEIEAEGHRFGEVRGEAAERAMEALSVQYPGQIELSIKANGFTAPAGIVEKALGLAGLDSFQAAKQTATGKVVF